MITLIETLNYRCLKYVSRTLGSFHVLVGPNASGKSTFLEVIRFIGALISSDLDEVLFLHAPDFQDLLWRRSGNRFELALEAELPEDIRPQLSRPACKTIRYEISIGFHQELNEPAILWEKVLLLEPQPPEDEKMQPRLFPLEPDPPQTVTTPSRVKGARMVLHKTETGNDNYYSETAKRWNPSLKLGPKRSGLGFLPADETRFPASLWFKNLLTGGVLSLALNCRVMHRASPIGQDRRLKSDGANLPLVVKHLRQKSPGLFESWLKHLQTALPDLEDVQAVTREEDRHTYLRLVYQGGVEAPAWVASDGTLRLLGLTLPAFLPQAGGIYMVEEPENGLHPLAVEAVCRALTARDKTQILLTTHSPIVLGLTAPGQVLCFARTPEGAIDIIPGAEHPALREWQGEVDWGVLLAKGVLG